MLHNRLQTDLKQAITDGDAHRVATLRLILAAIRDGEVARGNPADDKEILDILTRMYGQCAESIASSERKGEQDLGKRERREQGIIEKYLPTPMEESEMIQAVEDAIKATGAHSIRDIAKTVEHLRKICAGPHDLARASREVRRRLVS